MSKSALPPEFEAISRLVDAQEPNARELFQYALALLLVEDGKAEITERRTVSMREQLTVRTVAGYTFTIVKPDVREELLAQMQEMVREVLDEERGRLTMVIDPEARSVQQGHHLVIRESAEVQTQTPQARVTSDGATRVEAEHARV